MVMPPLQRKGLQVAVGGVLATRSSKGKKGDEEASAKLKGCPIKKLNVVQGVGWRAMLRPVNVCGEDKGRNGFVSGRKPGVDGWYKQLKGGVRGWFQKGTGEKKEKKGEGYLKSRGKKGIVCPEKTRNCNRGEKKTKWPTNQAAMLVS